MWTSVSPWFEAEHELGQDAAHIADYINEELIDVDDVDGGGGAGSKVVRVSSAVPRTRTKPRRGLPCRPLLNSTAHCHSCGTCGTCCCCL